MVNHLAAIEDHKSALHLLPKVLPWLFSSPLKTTVQSGLEKTGTKNGCLDSDVLQFILEAANSRRRTGLLNNHCNNTLKPDVV